MAVQAIQRRAFSSASGGIAPRSLAEIAPGRPTSVTRGTWLVTASAAPFTEWPARTAGSSNGRTPVSGTGSGGSTPSPAAGPDRFRRAEHDSETPAGGGLPPRAPEGHVKCDQERSCQGEGAVRLRPACLRPLVRVGHHAETARTDELTRAGKDGALVEAVQAGRQSCCTVSADAGSIPAGSTLRGSSLPRRSPAHRATLVRRHAGRAGKPSNVLGVRVARPAQPRPSTTPEEALPV